MRELLLGIDIGTSGCKLSVFGRSGEVIASETRSYPVLRAREGYAEQNPEDWWEAVCAAAGAILAKGVRAEEITAIGVDGQSWSAIGVDKAGNTLGTTPIWMDTRSQKECEQLNTILGKEQIFKTCGNVIQPMHTMPKILWYKNNEPEKYERISTVLQSNSFIVYKLTGALTQEPSQGYGWSCFDMNSGTWNYDMCRDAGIRQSILPEIAPCHAIVGRVSRQAAALTGLLAGTPVCAGGLDAACGTLGVGVIDDGQTQEQGGQAGGMSICLTKAYACPELILGMHVVPGRWLLQGGTVGGGGTMKWFEQEFGAEERMRAAEAGTSSFYELDREAGEIAPGSDGLILLPYLSGERSPIWDVNAKGVFYGIDYAKTRAHFCRAVMEGVAFSLRHNLEVASEAGAEVKTLYAMGGSANSSLWMQIKADITGHEIDVPASDTATALGAAMLAGVGTGYYPSFAEAVSQTVRVKAKYYPVSERCRTYDRIYAQYLELYPRLKSLMKEGSL